jgi:hypothetical protein
MNSNGSKVDKQTIKSCCFCTLPFLFIGNIVREIRCVWVFLHYHGTDSINFINECHEPFHLLPQCNYLNKTQNHCVIILKSYCKKTMNVNMCTVERVLQYVRNIIP